MPEPTLVDVTPAAFRKDNPNAQKNIQAASNAIKELDDVVRAKAEFLRELVEDNFDGIDGVCAAMSRYLDRSNPGAGDKNDAAVESVREQYEALQKRHNVVSETLLKAIAGEV